MSVDLRELEDVGGRRASGRRQLLKISIPAGASWPACQPSADPVQPFYFIRVDNSRTQPGCDILVSLDGPIKQAPLTQSLDNQGDVFGYWDRYYPGERRTRNTGKPGIDEPAVQLHLRNMGAVTANVVVELDIAPIVDIEAGMNQEANMVWSEGRAAWYRAAGTPHPYHPTAAYTDIIMPDEISANSHPAAGSLASVTLTNPNTGNQILLYLTGMTASLSQVVASAGEGNNVQVSGSIGGVYTNEQLVIGTAAFTVDRFVYRGQAIVSGNGNLANVSENLTITFSAGAVANVFHSINVYYHLGV